jgi:Epoxide hydrolase N terminus
MSSTVETASEIRPFQVDIPDEALDDLRRRIAAARWPSRELVTDRSQGVQLATVQELARYWTTDYDWRKAEAKLNALPQFTTTIDGVDIHFLHVRSQHEHALPLIMTHGWPGSVIELLEAVGPLTDPTTHGGRAEDAFHLVLPSLPGYGFSGEPADLGWNVGRVAQAWAELMGRLGYTRYVAQGGDVGAAVTDAMGRQAPEGLVGIHLNLLVTVLAGPQPTESEQERAAAEQLAIFRESGFGYFLEMATRPQTIGYALLDSPVALAAWMLDHDTDSYDKITRAFVDGEPAGNLTRDHIVDNVTLFHHVPWRDLAVPAQLGRAGLPHPHLLQRGRQGRPLRRLGGARAVLRGAPGGVRVTAVDEPGRPHAVAGRGDRLAQLRATGPGRAAGPRRGGELLDPDLHQLAAPGALCPCLVPGLPSRRVGRHRRPHPGVLL